MDRLFQEGYGLFLESKLKWFLYPTSLFVYFLVSSIMLFL